TMFAMYAIGLVLAPLVALLLKRTLLRGETPVFVMELPQYKWPSVRTVLGRGEDAGGSFLYRAGTRIPAGLGSAWGLLYFPHWESGEQTVTLTDPETGAAEARQVTTYDAHVAALREQLDRLQERKAKAGGEAKELHEAIGAVQEEIDRVNGEWKRQ